MGSRRRRSPAAAGAPRGRPASHSPAGAAEYTVAASRHGPPQALSGQEGPSQPCGRTACASSCISSAPCSPRSTPWSSASLSAMLPGCWPLPLEVRGGHTLLAGAASWARASAARGQGNATLQATGACGSAPMRDSAAGRAAISLQSSLAASDSLSDKRQWCAALSTMHWAHTRRPGAEFEAECHSSRAAS